MFDAGEGIQLALKKGGLGIRPLDAIAISHLHADHVLGLPGVLMFRAQCDDPGPLTIIGPPGIERFIKHTLQDLRYRLNFTIHFVEWSEQSQAKAWSWHGHSLFWEPLRHSTFCLGYRLEEAERPGKFDLQKANALNIPKGPLFGQLQNGRAITLEDGTVITPQDVLGPRRRGRIITFATDTSPCNGLKNLCTNADLAIVEGMFTLAHEKEAAEKKHSTAASSAQIAAKANTKQLVLVHISPRYNRSDEDTLQHEAKQFFKNVTIGRALDVYPVELPD